MDPVQAANILLSVWQVLHHSADAPPRDDRPVASTAQDSSSGDRAARQQQALEERLDRLVLVVHATWTLLSEKMGITDAELIERITQLDAADGTVDGRVTAPPMRCSCGAMVCRRLGRCLFCGKAYPAGTAFESL